MKSILYKIKFRFPIRPTLKLPVLGFYLISLILILMKHTVEFAAWFSFLINNENEVKCSYFCFSFCATAFIDMAGVMNND